MAPPASHCSLLTLSEMLCWANFHRTLEEKLRSYALQRDIGGLENTPSPPKEVSKLPNINSKLKRKRKKMFFKTTTTNSPIPKKPKCYPQKKKRKMTIK